jgi:hypothetical protein
MDIDEKIKNAKTLQEAWKWQTLKDQVKLTEERILKNLSNVLEMERKERENISLPPTPTPEVEKKTRKKKENVNE